MKKIATLLFALLAAIFVLTACEKKETAPAPSAPPAAQQTAPAEAPPATPEPAPAETAPTDAAPTEAAPAEAAPEADTNAAALPESCEAYLAKVGECMQKNANNPDTVNMLKEQEAQLRETWTKEADKDALDASCKQATDIFAQNAAGMGC